MLEEASWVNTCGVFILEENINGNQNKIYDQK